MGLKKGGVLNIVRRKVELKCPIENIPDEIIVDLDNIEINTSLKISSVKLPDKVEETPAEGEVPAEGAVEGVEDPAKADDSKDKTGKPSDDKTKAAPAEKGKDASKETK